MATGRYYQYHGWMETLGSLCDKLTVVALKRWHSTDQTQLDSLAVQQQHLQDEIASFVAFAVSGAVPRDEITFVANKVIHKGIPALGDASELITLGKTMTRLAALNCELWHEIEKSYDDDLSLLIRAELPKSIATLNLLRNQCIDRIDALFAQAIAAG